MATERFENQRELLEYINKNPNDRSLIQRMMRRGEVYKEDGGYYLVIEDEKEIKKADSQSSGGGEIVDDVELKRLKEMNDKLMRAYKKERDRNEVYMGMYDHLVFFYNKFLGYKKFVDGKVYGQSEYNRKVNGTQDTTETVRQGVYTRYNFEYGEVEDDECKAVEAIISERGEELSEIPF